MILMANEQEPEFLAKLEKISLGTPMRMTEDGFALIKVCGVNPETTRPMRLKGVLKERENGLVLVILNNTHHVFVKDAGICLLNKESYICEWGDRNCPNLESIVAQVSRPNYTPGHA